MSDDFEAYSRRSFLQTGTMVFPAAQATESALGKTQISPQRLTDSLFYFKDTCNVFAIKKGSRAILIDFGSGGILQHLDGMGIVRVDWILHTHHHRDQAQGDLLAVRRGIPIAVPEHERSLFEDAENFWRNRRIFEMYDVNNDFLTLVQNVKVSRVLRDYSTFSWSGIDILVQPTPGHTPGSITLLAKVDRQLVGFTGDLIYAAGKVQTLYDLQYNYQEHEGVDLSISSLAHLIKAKPALLCPSHGEPIGEPVPAMVELSRKLIEWHRYWYQHPPTVELEPYSVSPHLVASTETTSSFYAVVSKSGKALLIDYGGASWTFFQVFTRYVDKDGHMRFVEHTLDKLQSKFGVKSFDVAIPTHMHDDHINGMPYLQEHRGTKLWVFENFVNILQKPRDRNLGCTFGKALKADRVLHQRETFQWEEFEFTAVHSPGHTNFQMALFTVIDGQRVAFTGDAFFSDSNSSKIRHNLIYRNDVRQGDHLRSVRNLLEFKPTLIAPGHGKPFPLNEEMVLTLQSRLEQQDRLFDSLIADGDANLGLDPSWIRISPYQVQIKPGQEQKLTVVMRNYRRIQCHLTGQIVLPQGWRSRPAVIDMDVAPQSTAAADMFVTVPKNWRENRQRVAIALDLQVNGQLLGQLAEAIVDVSQPSVSPADL